MDTAAVKYGIQPLIIATAGVIALEFTARFFHFDPLVVTGGIRILDGLLILGVSAWFTDRARIGGLVPPDFRNGIRKGIIWSAVFAALAAAGAMICLAVGINPLKLIRVRLPSGTGEIVLFFLVGGLVGPIAEELFFRGVIYGFLRKWGFIAALFGSTAMFVFAHGWGGIGIPQLVGGLVFAAAYEYEKNLLVPIIIHVTGNLALFSLGFF